MRHPITFICHNFFLIDFVKSLILPQRNPLCYILCAVYLFTNYNYTKSRKPLNISLSNASPKKHKPEKRMLKRRWWWWNYKWTLCPICISHAMNLSALLSVFCYSMQITEQVWTKLGTYVLYVAYFLYLLSYWLEIHYWQLVNIGFIKG